MLIKKHSVCPIKIDIPYLHDDILLAMHFDKEKKTITLDCVKYQNNTSYNIICKNVIGFEMSCCDFWGPSECILDFEIISDECLSIIPNLERKWENDSLNTDTKKKYDDFFEILFTFTSGDTLRVACESVEL